MIEQELLFLGLLKESPKHGYQIKIKIKELLSLFSGIELKSIYYPLQVLEKKGLVTKKFSREGRRPQREVYALTTKGESRFNELLCKSFLNLKRPQFSLDLSLYFLNYLKPSVLRRRLRGRLQMLNKLAGGLENSIHSLKKKESISLVYILEHNLRMVESEAKFLVNFLKKV